MNADLWLLGKVYLVTLFWQILGWSGMSLYFKKLTDRGWAITRVLTTICLSLVIWTLAYLGLPVNTRWGVWLVLLVTLLISLFIYKKRGLLKKEEIKKTLVYIVMEEYLFIVGFFIIALTRGFNPEIHTLEKFMDFGFVNSYLHSPTLPAMDMWFAQSGINYYSFGHFWASILIRLMGVSTGVGYNLLIALLAGLGLMLSFSIITNLVSNEKGKVLGGILGSVAVCIGGNSHSLWYFLSHKFSMNSYWYADATRFIYNTIHEFPSYSFVVSDLHGHLLDLPVVLSFLIIFYYWTINRGLIEEIIMGTLLGVMMMTNTWDVPIYGLLLGIYGLWLLLSQKIQFGKLIKTGMVVGLTGMLVALPWWSHFQSISSGIGLVTLRSPFWQILVLWTGGFVSLVSAAILSKKGKNNILIWSLGVVALILILIPELIFAKDIYPNHPRANTMFKLTYQAFILMGISLGVAVGNLKNIKNRLIRITISITLMMIFGGSLLFTTNAFPTYYGDFKDYQGLDGQNWFRKTIPDRAKLSDYLLANRDGRNMVEAVGDSYTNYNAISVYSAVPTVLGWRVHEWLWRGGWTLVGSRDTEVENFYEDESVTNKKAFVEKYNVGWIVVGDDERNVYNINEKRLNELGEVVIETNGTYLIKVKR